MKKILLLALALIAVAPVAVEGQQRAVITGCDFDVFPVVAVERVNLWATAENGRIVGSARGVNPSERRGSPAWCSGEVVTVLERRTDSNGRRRVRVRTISGLEGWVTDHFLIEP